MSNFAKVTFTRNLSDDLDVVRDAGLTEHTDPLKVQFLKEFEALAASFTFVEAESLGGPEYRFVVNVDLGDVANQSPAECLASVVAKLQEPYTDGFAAGHFDVDAIFLDGTEFKVDELLTARPAGI